MQEKLYVELPDGIHNNYGLTYEGTEDRADQFKSLMHSTLDKKLNWFHQGRDTGYHYFEFWTDNHDLILSEVLRIADAMRIDLDI